MLDVSLEKACLGNRSANRWCCRTPRARDVVLADARRPGLFAHDEARSTQRLDPAPLSTSAGGLSMNQDLVVDYVLDKRSDAAKFHGALGVKPLWVTATP